LDAKRFLDAALRRDTLKRGPTMKVHELIKQLQSEPPDSEVMAGVQGNAYTVKGIGEREPHWKVIYLRISGDAE
jgi:hypothetical protein